ncbi:MAG: hypothetical protein UU61_C0003G0010 [Parcubacteria group bacterium GW2011_GWB1_41_4]|nr:MAG: hypothetical protein UU61_C0003G0010 [Parcubacteria group bacterium GW2011_GWB1_41_4]
MNIFDWSMLMLWLPFVTGFIAVLALWLYEHCHPKQIINGPSYNDLLSLVGKRVKIHQELYSARTGGFDYIMRVFAVERPGMTANDGGVGFLVEEGENDHPVMVWWDTIITVL